MSNWQWNGARWWKFDFHTHTPASEDYGKGVNQNTLKAHTPRDWLLDYMRKDIDCVAITDHNSGAWIECLKRSLAELESESPPDYRPLYLFPGVEISVNGGVHLLAIFGCETSTTDIDSLLGAIGFNGTKGSSGSVTTKSFVEVAKTIAEMGGIAIPAHVDESNGLLLVQTGTTLQQALECETIFAMELVDSSYQKPQLYIDKKIQWTEVVGTDSHHPAGELNQNCPGSRYTWIKMGTPNIDGLRLALLDGPLSVSRSDTCSHDPNQHAPLALESFEVSKARYLGRSKDFAIEFNPWLNTIIGGRGTGKSTIVEFLRLCLRREKELPASLESDFQMYTKVYKNREDSGLLTDSTEIRVVYRKDGTAFRIQWNTSGSLTRIQERTARGWIPVDGDIRHRFPVRMYSQKQIFQIARTPLALLEIIDDAPEVDHATWRNSADAEENQYLALLARIRKIAAGLSEESKLKGELEDVKRKLAIFEQSGHADILKALQKRRCQNQAIESWVNSLSDVGQRLRRLAKEINPDDLDESTFDEAAAEDFQLLEAARRAGGSIREISASLETLAESADTVLAGWQEERDSSAWKKELDKVVREYATLQERLEKEGVPDSSGYEVLLQKRHLIESQLKELEGHKEQVEELRGQAIACLNRIAELRREITKKRESFLRGVLKGNRYVRISVIPYGAKETVEDDIRRLIQRQSGGFEKDIGNPIDGGLLGDIYAGDPDTPLIEKRLDAFKRSVAHIADSSEYSDVADRRFASHLAKLPPEALDRLKFWFPEDSLDVQYSTSADNTAFRPIQEGSPGQRTAALLAFLLSYGDEPLILDQPEDDLDNHLIYDLIVTQLREVKLRRQVIVVTHNANIVVNGDAELVEALAVKGGQTLPEAEGSLQEKSVRQTICTVMEGGEKAFAQRYRRIALEGRHS